MQKKLLTIAVAGALAAPAIAHAQSSVQVFGRVTMHFANVKYSGSTAGAPSLSKWDVINGASEYGLRGRENLGGGLTAWFQISQNAPLERSMNVAITPASRNSAVGLQGGWGNFFIGQWTTPWADLESLWSVGTVGTIGPTTSIMGRRETTGTAPNYNCANGHTGAGLTWAAGTTTPLTSVCDAVEGGGGVGHPFWRRISNAIFYQSPVWSGIQVKLAYQTNEGKANGAGVTTNASGTPTVNANPSMWSASIHWTGMGGKARLGFGTDRHKDFTTVGQSDTGWKIVGGYDFGPVNIGAAYERNNYKAATGSVKARQYGFAASIPVGHGSVKGSYSKARDLTGLPGTGAKQFNIGYDHHFSKRTDVGIAYAKISNGAAAVFTWTGLPPVQNGASNTPLAGSDPSLLYVSINHRF